MAKRLSFKQKEEILKRFSQGDSPDQLSEEFKCTKLTISRNLKKQLGEETYKNLLNKINPISLKSKININHDIDGTNNLEKKISTALNSLDKKDTNYNLNEAPFSTFPFTEIVPLNFEIDNEPQKDLSSVSIEDVTFPKVVYMIVNKNIELETKLLKDYPEWQFLSEKELSRNTIQIYFDIKIAKRFCSNQQKVIKVPNTNVFKIVAPILVSKGITRIVTAENLISL